MTAVSLSVVMALSLGGCKSKAQKQAELALADLATLDATIAHRHIDSLARALPNAARDLGVGAKPGLDLHVSGATLGASFVTARDKTDELRSAKRSYYMITDAQAEVVFVDDDAWTVVGRKLALGFPIVKETIDGAALFGRGSGRYGGASEDSRTFVEVAKINDASGKTLGALVAAWEAHDAATDLQRQLSTALAMKTAIPQKRVKQKDRLKIALDTPELWVAIFDGSHLFLEEDAPQALLDAINALQLVNKTATGPWSDTFEVSNHAWGGAAKRVPALGAEVGVAVVRHDP
ncbi:MAG: hypothetical protein NVSMB1_03680 [Polyangiales bacterium]